MLLLAVVKQYVFVNRESLYDHTAVLFSKSLPRSVYRMDGAFIDQLVNIFILFFSVCSDVYLL